MKCLYCNKEYKAKRADAKFCSAKCRLEYFRKNETLNNETLNETDNETLNKEVFTDTNGNKYKIGDKGFKGYEIVGRDWKGNPTYYCGNHQEHNEVYCNSMCIDCKHIIS